MAYWWATDPSECFWCEVTDREDLGADLKCPTRHEGDKEYWSYSLIKAIWPGDIVFHYSTVGKAFVGASVAGGPLEDRPIIWASHGTYGRGKKAAGRQLDAESPRPGWWLPLYRYTRSSVPLALEELARPQNRDEIIAWIDSMQERHNFVAAPVTRYRDGLRASQGYLFKMPAEWVARWPALNELATTLDQAQEELAGISDHFGAPAAFRPPAQSAPGVFRLKSGEDYEVAIRGGVQRRTRHHEKLIRIASEAMQALGAHVTMPHPVDLMVHSPVQVIFEAKTFGGRSPLFAVRDAVGQLLEYRHFRGPHSAALGILLESDPGRELVTYVEDVLGMLLAWWDGTSLRGGPRTVEMLAVIGVTSA